MPSNFRSMLHLFQPTNHHTMRTIIRTLRLHSRTTLPRQYSTLRSGRLSQFLKVSDEVRSAVAAGKPVVALESAIYTHGFPHPQNLELAKEIEKAVRDNGAVPATICVLNGKAMIGLDPTELEQLTNSAGSEDTMKVSRRDLAFMTGISFVDPSRSFVGGTTIAGTSILAHMAGIKVFATGGLGGVHRGVQKTMDVSADLTELGRTPIALICAGSKAFLDLEKTLEYLETEGVYVGTFGDRNSQQPVEYPAFYSRGCGIKSPSVVANAKEAAGIIYASHALGLTSGQIFANPIPEEYEIPHEEMKTIIKSSINFAEKRSSGKDVTPFILSDILKRTGGKSIHANRGLILNNAAMGARVAVELAKLEGEPVQQHPVASMQFISPTPTADKVTNTSNSSIVEAPEVLVVGGVAVDVSCNYTPPKPTASTPALHTSNPSRIAESLGGVANNVAYALHLCGTKTKLISAVGDDISGRWVLEQIQRRGMDTSGITTSPTLSTARYVAVNDAKGDLFVASADMQVIEQLSVKHITDSIASSSAKWIVIDGNTAPVITSEVLRYCQRAGVKVVFEPTSAAKSTAIFAAPKHLDSFPNHSVFAAAPNTHELDAMYAAADAAELFSTKLPWWNTVDSLLIDSRFRDSIDVLSRESKVDLVSTGIVQKAVKLAPYIPNLFVKLGAQGCLVVSLLPAGHNKKTRRGTLVVTAREGEAVSGLLVQHFEAEKVENLVSVNGAGDTFLGVLVAGMVKDLELEKMVERAQRAAVLTLASEEAVSERLSELGE